jgi:hypothetical protein
MTEEEWQACADVGRMVRVLRPRSSHRKLRLFACACCDRIADLLEEDSRAAFAVVRRAAEGLVDEAERWRAHEVARDTTFGIVRRIVVAAFGEEGYVRYRQGARTLRSGPPDAMHQAVGRDPAFHAAWAVVQAATSVHGAYEVNVSGTAAEAAVRAGGVANNEEYRAALEREQTAHCDLLRDLFGNPFRPTSFDAAWRTTAAVGVAQAIYDLDRFADLPILADALEDAGCCDEAILSHCRRPGRHVRGCWVVDAVLNRS